MRKLRGALTDTIHSCREIERQAESRSQTVVS